MDEDTKKLERIKQDYHDTFASPHGQRVLQDLVLHRMISAPTLDTHENMAFIEGQRSVVMSVMDMAGYRLSIAPIKE